MEKKTKYKEIRGVVSRATRSALHDTRGFTLVEMVVYLAILSLMTVLLVTTLVSLAGSFSAYQATRDVERSARDSLERMVREIRQAEQINLGASTLGTHPGVLSLTYGTTTVEFSLSGDRLLLRVNGAQVGPLTLEGVAVDNLVFRRSVSGKSEGVSVELSLERTRRQFTAAEDFEAFAVLRGSY